MFPQTSVIVGATCKYAQKPKYTLAGTEIGLSQQTHSRLNGICIQLNGSSGKQYSGHRTTVARVLLLEATDHHVRMGNSLAWM